MTSDSHADRRDPHDARRGRRAGRPHRIPPTGWRDIALRVWRRAQDDRISLLAAGVAFFGLLALFPALGSLISLAALLFEPDLVVRQFDGLSGLAPDAALSAVRDQATALAAQTRGEAGAAAIASLVVSVVWASRGVDNLIDGINAAHAEVETRGLVRRFAVSLALTIGLTALTLVALALTVVVPTLADWVGLKGLTDLIVDWGRWPLLAVSAMAALALIYRYAPARRSPRWSWATPGAIAATCVWLAGSFGFAAFVRVFGAYNPTYGALAGVVILLLWMWMTGFSVLLGAQLNAETEHQTRHDTTRGPDRPMGHRGARMADTLGRRP